ncbi:MAG: hypothetical protein MUO64_07520 [Anaerolineales bacterium]|nr:hypothetical protein [Anaerolineales bacterium]
MYTRNWLLSLLLVFTIVLTACGGPATKAPGAETPPPAGQVAETPPPAEKVPVVLHVG